MTKAKRQPKPVGDKMFWLDDLQWSILEKHLPTGRRGVQPRENRKIISGIIHVLQTGCRWQDCPKDYGPSTTVYNRFHRWAKQGLWQKIFNELVSIVGTHYENSIDSTSIKAHRSASGKRGAVRKPLAKAEADAQPKFTRLPMKKAVR
jgi:transposase